MMDGKEKACVPIIRNIFKYLCMQLEYKAKKLEVVATTDTTHCMSDKKLQDRNQTNQDDQERE